MSPAIVRRAISDAMSGRAGDPFRDRIGQFAFIAVNNQNSFAPLAGGIDDVLRICRKISPIQHDPVVRLLLLPIDDEENRILILGNPTEMRLIGADDDLGWTDVFGKRGQWFFSALKNRCAGEDE